MRRRGGSGWVVGGKWGWLIAILKRGVVQGGRQGQRREKIYTLTKGERSEGCVCVWEGKKVRRETWVTITAEIHFLHPPNSSHTHRYCHRAIPSFQRWFKKRLQERTRFLYSRPVAMVTQNWVTPSLSLTLSPSYGQIIKSAHRCSPEHSGRLNVRLLALLVLWWLKCT